jgi:hypothetical protein
LGRRLLVVDADYDCFGDAFVSVEQLFDFDRIHVLPTGDDHVVLAADHKQPAPRVEVAAVAGGQQAVDVFLATTAGVTVETGCVGHEYPPDRSGGERCARVVEDLHPHAWSAATCRGGGRPQLRRTGHGCGRDFGGTVDVVQPWSEPIQYLGHQPTGNRRPARGDDAQRAGVGLRELRRWQRADSLQHRRNHHQHSRLPLAHLRESLCRIELRGRHHRR